MRRRVRADMLRAHMTELSDENMEKVLGGAAGDEGGILTHTVVGKETISSISRQYHVSSIVIAEANRDVIISTAQRHGVVRSSLQEYSAFLYPGEELVIPK